MDPIAGGVGVVSTELVPFVFDGRQVRVTINGRDLPVVYYRGQRVITLAQVDDLHGKQPGTAGRFFRRNRHRLIKDKHYFRLKADEPIGFKVRLAPTQGGGKPIILLTEKGYCLIAKPYDDDLAWDVQDQLVEGYFRADRKSSADVTPWLCFDPRPWEQRFPPEFYIEVLRLKRRNRKSAIAS
jgi:hypothetical protein